MKQTLIILSIVFTILTAYIYFKQREEIKRLKDNLESLKIDSNTHIVVTKSELKAYQLYKKELDSLKIAPRNLKRINVTTVGIKTDTVVLEKTKEIVKYKDKDYSQYSTNYECFTIDVLATDEPVLLPFDINIKVRQYEYYKRKKILWLPIGRKYIETKVVTNCGNVKTEVIEVVE